MEIMSKSNSWRICRRYEILLSGLGGMLMFPKANMFVQTIFVGLGTIF